MRCEIVLRYQGVVMELEARLVMDSRIRRPCSGRRGAIRCTMVAYILSGRIPVSRKFESLAGGRVVSFEVS